MRQSAFSPYQATLFVRRSARDAVITAAREFAVDDPVVVRDHVEDGNVLRIRLTFTAATATEAEQLLRRTFRCIDAVLAISDIELRPSFPERRRSYEVCEAGGGSDGPPGKGAGSQR